MSRRDFFTGVFGYAVAIAVLGGLVAIIRMDNTVLAWQLFGAVMFVLAFVLAFLGERE